MVTRSCCWCNRELRLDIGCNDFVVLKPCNCNCCPKCAFSETANRKFDILECPKCKIDITSFVFYESDRLRYKGGHEKKLKIEKPTLGKDPCRYFLDFVDSKIESFRDRMLLTLTYCDEVENKVFSMNSVLDKKQGPESEKDSLNLRLMFALLHPSIMVPHLQHLEKEKHPRMTATQFAEYCLAEDKSYLLQLLYALGTGKTQCHPIKLEAHKFKNDRASYLAICVAKQMIERANTRKPGPLQIMIGDTLKLLGASSDVVNFLSKFRISEARTTTERRLLVDSLNQSMNSIRVDPLDAFCLHLDNFGFTGWRGRWSQHTVIQVSVIKKEQLIELGFYRGGHINRNRKEIDDLLEEANHDQYEVAKQVVAPRKKDYEILTDRVMKTIRSAISYDLPSPDDSRLFLQSSDYWWRTEFPSNMGIDLPNDTNEKRVASSHSRNPVAVFANKDLVAEDPGFSKTYYEQNNIEIENVLHGDPNGYLVVRRIMDHLEKKSGKASFFVEDEEQINWDQNESGGEEPVRFIISPATADGAPAKRSLDLYSNDISENGFEDRSYKLAKIFLSGFHFQMEFLTMRGRLFRDLFAFFGRKWRESDPAFNWILTIRDPREALKEYREYLLAHYRAAAEASSKENPVEVHNYMLDRAVEIPTCMATLFDLRLLQIVFMIQDAEKSGSMGDVSLFLTTMRFALPLFCITHAVNYCHLAAEFLEWHELASDAERILFENFYYTKLSPHGKPIWVDRGVEWTVRHIRSFLGHKMRPQNHDKLVGRVVSDIPFRVKAKRDLRHLLGSELNENYTSKPWNEQTFSLGPAFHATRVALADTNFWGPGPLEGELMCTREDTGIFVDANTGGDNEKLISASILGGYDLGIKRAIGYYIEHHIDQRNPKTRSEKEVGLKLLPTIHKTRKDDFQITKAIRVSCNVEELEPLKRQFPVSSILRELKYYKQYLFPDIEYKTTKERKPLLKILCEYRQKYFREYPDVFASMHEGLDALEESDGISTKNSREKQIKSPIFQLDEDALSAYL